MERDGEGSNPNLHKANGKRKLIEIDLNEPGLDEVMSEQGLDGFNGSFSRQEDGTQFTLESITKIMEKNLPHNFVITQDSKELVQACAKEFIGFITDEAIQRCHSQARNKITADDIIAAFSKLGFDDYVVCLNSFLSKYRRGG